RGGNDRVWRALGVVEVKVKVAPTKLGNVLRALAAFVDENPGSEVHSLLADVWGAPAVKKAQRAKPGRKRSTVDVEAIVEQLRTAISREQGHSNIDAAGLTRIDLE